MAMDFANWRTSVLRKLPRFAAQENRKKTSVTPMASSTEAENIADRIKSALDFNSSSSSEAGKKQSKPPAEASSQMHMPARAFEHRVRNCTFTPVDQRISANRSS